MNTIYAVRAEDFNENYPRYFVSLDAACAYAKRMAKVVGLSSWIDKILFTDSISEDGVTGVGHVGEEEFLSDSD